MSLLLGLVVISFGWGAARPSTNRRVQIEVRNGSTFGSTSRGDRHRERTACGSEGKRLDRSRCSTVCRSGSLFVDGAGVWTWGSEPGKIVVAYRGERAANPIKDSVLILTAEGWRRADLTGRASGDIHGPAEWIWKRRLRSVDHRSADCGCVSGQNLRAREPSTAMAASPC